MVPTAADIKDISLSFSCKCDRPVNVLNAYADLPTYQRTFVSALLAEIETRLAPMASTVSASLFANNKLVAIPDLSRILRNRGVPFYASNDLQLIRAAGETSQYLPPKEYQKQKQRQYRASKRRKAEEEDETGDAASGSTKSRNEPNDTSCRYFLKILNGKEHSSKYARDDLWVVCLSPSFGLNDSDPSGHPVLFFKSVFHGPAGSGMLQVEPFGNSAKALTQLYQIRSQTVYGMRGPNCSSELAMIAALQRMNPAAWPLISLLLGSTPRSNQLGTLRRLQIQDSVIASASKEVFERFKLNDDQRAVIERTLEWLRPTTSTIESPFVLVHGAFGSGKSYLLVALIVLFDQILKVVDPGGTVRILVAGQTNVAGKRVVAESPLSHSDCRILLQLTACCSR